MKDQPRLGTADGSQSAYAGQKRSVVEAECTERVKSMTAMVVCRGSNLDGRKKADRNEGVGD